MSDLYKEIERNRRLLLRQERTASREITRAYQKVAASLIKELDKLDLGDNVFARQRRASLLRQVNQELTKFANSTLKPNVNSNRILAATRAQEHQLRLIGIQAPSLEASFARLPVRTIETMFSMTESGPLARLIGSFGPEAASRMNQTLIEGIALGYNPNKVASLLVQDIGISRSRATLISRTEMLRAHRESSRETYQNNRHIVKSWAWHSATDDRTCATCWGMHGTQFDVDEHMPAHPGCRCAMVPITRTWVELGLSPDETRYEPETGSSLFAQQSPQTQKTILGPAAYESYKRGDVDITDFVGYKQSSWGTTVTRKPNRMVIPGE